MSVPLRVLLVEDSEDDAELVALELRRAGYEVTYERVDTEPTMKAALARPWDLILADYSMPAFSALRAIEVMQEARLDVPLILISGSIGEELAVAAMKAGALDYLLKQNLTRLVPAVARELREAEVRRERRRAETALRFLADASATLAESLDYGATLSIAARLAVPILADWCIIDIVEDREQIRRMAAIHADPGKESLLHRLQERYPPDRESPQPAARALRTGEAQLFPEVSDSVLRSLCLDEQHAELVRSLGASSIMAVPLVTRGKSLGAITFASADPQRRFGPADLLVAQELARRAAIAIDNARLFGELQEAVRARDEFLSIASHELRTPLMPLQLQVQSVGQIVRRDLSGALAERLSGKLEIADRQVMRLTRLVDDLLDVSRIGAGGLELRLEVVELGALMRDVVARHQVELGRAGCPVSVHADAKIVGMWDRLRLDQVLTNLLSNAAKFGSGKPIELAAEATNGMARFSVRDHGIGVAPGDQARIFGKFVRAVPEREYGGLGLGLWIARQIVTAHGGSIGVESQPGVSTTFTVELPRVPPQGKDARELRLPATRSAAGEIDPLPLSAHGASPGQRSEGAVPAPAARYVLIVDDDADILSTLRAILEDEGYLVATALNGSEALAYLRGTSVPPAVILLDLTMPVVSGWQFRAEQKKDPALARIPVVVITAGSVAPERVESIEAAAVIQKPFRLDGLLSAIQRCAAPAA